MKIEKQITTVYHAPTRGRRYFSKQKAIWAEAMAIIFEAYPYWGHPMDSEYNCESPLNSNALKFRKLFKRVCRIIQHNAPYNK
jgi:hypothetical protein